MKKLMTLLLIAVLTFALTGCGPEIEDTNGPDDYSLATITDENIVNLDLGASSYSCSPAESDLFELTKFKGKAFSGVTELYYIDLIGKSDLTFDLSTIEVDAGNFSLMVLVDDEIVHEFNHEEMMQTFELKDVSGYVSLRMAGESADFKFHIQVF